MPFSSLKFLHRSVKRTARRKRLEELLLLAVRVGLILLLALALSRPFLGGAGAAGGGSRTSAVIVLDDSGSMSCEHNRKTRFSRAKAAADRLLAGLKQGDSMFLRFASGRRLEKYRALEDYGQLTSDRAYIIEELVKARCTFARGNLAAQIAESVEVLARQSDPNRELYVVTDLQRSSLRGLSARLARLSDRSVSVVFVDVSDPDFQSAAVTDVVVRSRTRAAGEPATVQAQVRNASAGSARLEASLFLGGMQVGSRRLEVESGSSASISFPCHLGSAGVHHGRVEIGGDSMSFDNVRHFRTEVLSRVRVLVIAGNGAGASPDAPRPGSFFLLRALDPLDGRGLISPQAVAPAAAAVNFDDYAAVLLSDLARVPRKLGTALRDYVAAGGGLVVFPPPTADAESYRAAFADPGDGSGPLLAADLGAPLAVPEDGGDGLAVTGLDFTHPVMLPFKGPARAGFRQVRVRAGLRLAVPEDSRDPELMTLEGALPFLVARDFGRGRTYLFASPADAGSSSLPLQNVFVPLLHSLVYDLAELGERRGEYAVGASAVLRFPGRTGRLKVRLKGPDGRSVELETSGPQNDNSCTWGPLEDPGVYRYTVLPDGPEGSFVVNPDPLESDLDLAGRAEIRRLFAGFRHVAVCGGPEEVDRTVAEVRQGRDLSGTFLALILALAVFECFFANYMTGMKRAAAGPAGSAP
jgi:hypothetical protein